MNNRETPGDHHILAIRTARTTSASPSARHTSSVGESLRPAGNEGVLAATEAASGLRIVTPLPFGGKSKGLGSPRPLLPVPWTGLFQRGADRIELLAEGGAHAVDRGDDRDGNAGGDQAVFDGGGAGLILHET